MKKLLLVIVITTGSIAASLAQSCTPGANYADSTFGAWPDTLQNFPPAYVSVSYTTDLNFKVPSDAGNVDPTYTGLTIQSFTVDSVTGLPPGMNYSCNIPSCTYNGGDNGCAQITGTCGAAGTYNQTIYITAILDFFGNPVPYPYSFTGYKINVGNMGTIESIINPIMISPNPANDKITLSGLNKAMKISSINITNMEGKVIKNVPFSSASVDVELNDMENGIYFVVVEHVSGKEVIKFIKE